MKYRELRPRQVLSNPVLLNKYVGWFLSEKIDGWQAIWDGKGTMYTKSFKKMYNLPDSWLQLLPPIPLIGEIRIDNLPATSVASLASLKDQNLDLWKNTHFHIFDFGSKYHSKAPFKDRYQLLEKLVNVICLKIPDCPIVLIKQIKIKSKEHIIHLYKKILDSKGEGVIITEPNSTYVEKSTRVSNRVKLKGRNDMEGLVIGYNLKPTDPSRMSSLEVELLNEKKNPTGIQFKLGIGFTNRDRHMFRKNSL